MIHTLFGKRLSRDWCCMGIHFENFHYVHPGKVTTLFHHSTNTFMKDLLFANYNMRPGGTKFEQQRPEPCIHCSIQRRGQENQSNKTIASNYSFAHIGKAWVSWGQLSVLSISVHNAWNSSFLRCIEHCFFF